MREARDRIPQTAANAAPARWVDAIQVAQMRDGRVFHRLKKGASQELWSVMSEQLKAATGLYMAQAVHARLAGKPGPPVRVGT